MPLRAATRQEAQDGHRPVKPLDRFFDELTQAEIADKVGISQMHVSRLLSRSLTALRKELGTLAS